MIWKIARVDIILHYRLVIGCHFQPFILRLLNLPLLLLMLLFQQQFSFLFFFYLLPQLRFLSLQSLLTSFFRGPSQFRTRDERRRCCGSTWRFRHCAARGTWLGCDCCRCLWLAKVVRHNVLGRCIRDRKLAYVLNRKLVSLARKKFECFRRINR